jgi:pimeloyl-ACP methyl ester carboxylesterase
MPVSTPKPGTTIDVRTPDGCRLQLLHHPGPPARPVLLVHGASAGSDTFRIGERQTLVDFLLRKGCDVWTLDWRASKNCLPQLYCEALAAGTHETVFTIDAAAAHDVPAALATMRAQGVREKIGVVGHCMGGAIVAQGIVQRVIAGADVEHVVLTGLGLFYKAALDNIVKAEDPALDQLILSGQHLLHPTKQWRATICAQDPGDGPWNDLLENPYQVWLETPLPHDCGDTFCHRLSYMYGMPYMPDLIPTIHPRHLPQQFGYIPLQFLLHCCQNLRRGYAGKFVTARTDPLPPDQDYLRPEAFRDRRLTLITGDLNSLWHRDSMDTMYEWLRRGRSADHPLALQKHVVAGFGHQDLHWGTTAPEQVFPKIASGLGIPA